MTVFARLGRCVRGRLRPRPPNSDALGRRGERVAARVLKRAGYRVVARRLRTTGGEVDLVALDGETLVLVEVKASLVRPDRGSRAARPADRVDHRKRRRLAGASRALRRGEWAGRPHRIDVVSVVFRGRAATTTIVRGAVVASITARGARDEASRNGI